MGRIRVTADHLRFRTAWAVLVSALLAFCSPSPVLGQTSNPATVQGFVRSADGNSVAGATVYLQRKTAMPPLTTRTTEDGAYTFSELTPGTYSLRAEMAGIGEANSDSFVVTEKENKKVDLTLAPGKAPGLQGSAAGQPEFFDEPKFTVAGVTDTANSGGHGSDTIRRTSESLAKDTVSLGAKPSAGPRPPAQAESSLREAAQREPRSFDANRRLGKFLLDAGRPGEALPFLEQASGLNPSDYDNAHTQAIAYAGAGQYQSARIQLRALLAEHNKAELHHALADADEKLSDPLDAVQEYQRAAEMDPSESNLFDWAAELLLHNAIEPAIEVFSKGNRLHPRSARMLLGLGAALYSQGSYEQAVQRLCDASDLNPDDPNPYLFLGKIQSMSLGSLQSAELVKKLNRFVALQPQNALANYYYAFCLWQQRQESRAAGNLAEIESLLQKAVRLDPKLDRAHLQLGILYAEQGDLPKAIAAYQRAAEANPELEDAHFRLARAYERTGEKLKAQQELKAYEDLSKKKTEEVEQQRRQIRQFVYQLQGQEHAAPPPR
jgi:tetratricopeptide (TPR) repeat protein